MVAKALRPVEPPLHPISPVDVACTVATRILTQLPDSVPQADVVANLPVDVVEALVQRAATAALDSLAAAWPRAVAEEHTRYTAALEIHKQHAAVAAQWNRRSRPVAVLGAPGMGYGFNVLPYLRRSFEGRALHATSVELRGACRLRRWAKEVRVES